MRDGIESLIEDHRRCADLLRRLCDGAVREGAWHGGAVREGARPDGAGLDGAGHDSDGTQDGRTGRDRLARRLVREMSVHDAVESQLLNPLVERRLPDGNRLARETSEQHAAMAAVLAEIDWRPPGDAHRRELLERLRDESVEHFATEERTLLVPLRRHLAPEELVRLDEELARARAKAPTHPHPHAPRFSIGTHAASAALRPVDRFRDALRRRP